MTLGRCGGGVFLPSSACNTEPRTVGVRDGLLRRMVATERGDVASQREPRAPRGERWVVLPLREGQGLQGAAGGCTGLHGGCGGDGRTFQLTSMSHGCSLTPAGPLLRVPRRRAGSTTISLSMKSCAG